MPDFLLLMHDDATSPVEGWDKYFGHLKKSGHFVGGSAIGRGLCFNKSGPAPNLSSHLTGFIRISAETLAHAQTLLLGNPVFEAGGTIEIRELPKMN